MFRTLMMSRRFAPLFWCQFFSAFNDNFIRNMLAMLILFRFGAENASLKILLATIVFILPAIPLSALGGEILGRLLPFVEPRLEPVPGIEDGTRLFIRGPNIMLGYYRPENPGVIEALPDGLYDTGDIVAIDGEGFVAIKGRAKRFAKIAGETVSLAAVEDLVGGLWPDHVAAAVPAPDPKRGERVILATTKPGATRAEVQAWMKAKGASEIMHPSSIVVLDAIPLLGSGKTNYVALAKALSEEDA